MLALMEVVNTNVDFGTAGHPARQLLAQEKIRVPPQRFGPFDAVVISECEQVHPAALQNRVDFFGFAVTLTTEFGENGGCAGSGKVRVDMHIALHDLHIKFTALRTDDMQAKV